MGAITTDRRFRFALIFAVAAFVISIVWLLASGAPGALRVAEHYLVSSEEVRRLMGERVYVKHPGPTFKSRIGWTPGKTNATFVIQLVGESESIPARVQLRKDPTSGWQVRSAVLLFPDSPRQLE